jgi:coronafacic acid polyketide synthase Cfa6
MELLPISLVVSGDSPDELTAAADELRKEVETTPAEALPQLEHRLLTTAHADHRGAVFATDRAGLLGGLTALAQGRSARNVLTGTADVGRKPVLVFPGQGLQWPGMAEELLTSVPQFREHVDRCAQALFPHLGWDPGVALVEREHLTRLSAIQPVQFALSSALADLWRGLGLHEAAVLGHSVGEITAAHASGVLDVEDAAKVLVLHGAALTRLEGHGVGRGLRRTRPPAAGRLERPSGHRRRQQRPERNGQW